MTSISSLLEQAAADHPEHAALRMDDLVLSYAQLREAAGRMSALLASLGVEPGDRVGLMLPNVPAFPIAFYGALAAGAIVVPMNPLLKSREVSYYLGDSGAKVVVAWHAAAGEAAKGAADAGAQMIAAETPDLSGLLADTQRGAGRVGPRRRRRRGHPVHLGHDRAAQGRRAHPRRAGPQRGARRADAVRRQPGRRDHGLPAAVPRVRADLRAERIGRLGGPP